MFLYFDEDLTVKATKYARFDGGSSTKQTLKAHLDGVTVRMNEYAGGRLHNISKLVGILHDCGKGSELWQAYFLSSINKDDVYGFKESFSEYQCPEMVPHSTQGARFIAELHGTYAKEISAKLSGEPRIVELTFNNTTADLLRYAILAHHGMFDAMSPDGRFYLENRAKPNDDKNEEVFNECKAETKCEYPDFDFLISYKNAVQEIKRLMNPLWKQTEFDIGFISRMLLSMIIDADWSDAAAFPDRCTEYENSLKDFAWDGFLKRIENKSETFTQRNELDRLRSKISDECKSAAERQPGIYKLNVPTGGGKTISAMRFALNHAKLHGKKRIIYVAPFISILEQNAEEYRSILAKDTEENKYITSHYTDVATSNFESALNENRGYENSSYMRVKAGIDNWSSPVIFTTMVQLLLTLFSSNKHSTRRLHNLADSVLIIDEYQALPIKSLSLFNRAINALSRYFGATVIICTATQPPLGNLIVSDTERTKIGQINYSDRPDLVGNYEYEIPFKRVELIDARKNKGKGGSAYSIEELTDFVSERMVTIQSLLVVLNTRKAVKQLYSHLLEKSFGDVSIYMLSNNMCPAHRNEILNHIKAELKKGIKILLVSTALIEAGVDISFAGVIRSLAGLDVIIQAAGRCNRNGEMTVGKVWIVEVSKDAENISKLKSLVIAQQALRPILDHFNDEPEKYESSIMSTLMLEKYFFNYYKAIGDQTCYPISGGRNLNELLAENGTAVKLYEKNIRRKDRSGNDFDIRARVKQSFSTAGREYKPIDDDSISLLVPYKEGSEIINYLNADKFRFLSVEARRNLLNKAGYFSVNIFRNTFDDIKENGGVFGIDLGNKDEIIYAVRDGFYGTEGLTDQEMEKGNKYGENGKSAHIF